MLKMIKQCIRKLETILQLNQEYRRCIELIFKETSDMDKMFKKETQRCDSRKARSEKVTVIENCL